MNESQVFTDALKLATPARLIRVSVTPPPGLSREDANSWLRRATRTPLCSRASAESCAAAQRATRERTVAVADAAGVVAGATGVPRADAVDVVGGVDAATALSRPLVRMVGAAGSSGAWCMGGASAGAETVAAYPRLSSVQLEPLFTREIVGDGIGAGDVASTRDAGGAGSSAGGDAGMDAGSATSEGSALA